MVPDPAGAKAVELVLAERFDVVLLDLMMPGSLDGFGVCERLRAEPTTKDMPIFIISAMDDPASREKARIAGATGFYGKPFRPLELLKDDDRSRRRRRRPKRPLQGPLRWGGRDPETPRASEPKYPRPRWGFRSGRDMRPLRAGWTHGSRHANGRGR